MAERGAWPPVSIQGSREISIVEIQHVRVQKPKTGVLFAWSALAFWAALVGVVVVGPGIDAFKDDDKSVK
jgi:hypothetical protein